MAIAIALFLIVVGSVVFHIVTPWWLTPLASNWGQMDLTIDITMWVTGFFFIVINLFVVYCLWRFRHRQGLVASYQHDNKKLEHWLIGVTSVGIIALLAPGLVVYANYVSPPSESMELEVLGQQWQWRYRFPGPDGKFGRSDPRFVAANNPFGIDPADPQAQDDLLVEGNEVHLPKSRPVKVVLRSHDVLHDFFVPQFRARMNIVPGQVGWFWFMPTKGGRYESMCAQLCGVGHPNMRGFVLVEDDAAFAAWRGKLPTFAASLNPAAALPGGDQLARGKALAASKGCAACHSIDGKPGVGPSWKGLFGKTETMEDGSTALVDDAFLRGFIRDPKSRDVKGFPNVMPQLPMSDDELDALVGYIKSLGTAPSKP
ncbi:MAG: cytochrome c oxidase subunit II [Burkholderiales bacterium]|nr:cytochrome c oxidase subunit II [Burkholderiales bacterium]